MWTEQPMNPDRKGNGQGTGVKVGESGRDRLRIGSTGSGHHVWIGSEVRGTKGGVGSGGVCVQRGGVRGGKRAETNCYGGHFLLQQEALGVSAFEQYQHA